MQPVAMSAPPALPQRRGYEIAKCILDMTLCVLAIPFALPLFAVVSTLIRLDSPGSVLCLQERVGKGGRRFRMLKFRTLPQNSDDSANREFMRGYVRSEVPQRAAIDATYKPLGGSQPTPLGRFLRRWSLDELPQLINVLRRDMSLVGPRPNVPWEVEEYSPWHCRRLEVLPGITGLAQVRGRSSIPFDRIVAYDIEYIEQQSLLLDLRILLRTVPCVVSGRGAR